MQADHPPSLSATLFEGAGLVAAGVALDCPEPTLVYVQNDTLYLQTADIAAVSAWAALIGGQIRTAPMDAQTVAHFAESDVFGQRVHVFCHQANRGRIEVVR